MHLRSFKNRLLILIVALVALAQGVTIALALVYLDRGVRAQAAAQLTSARAILDQALEQRSLQLKSTASVLVTDFGFREAVTSGDKATILSALGNHGQRIKSDLAVFFDADGNLVASSSSSNAATSVGKLHPPRDGDTAPRFAVIDGKPFQLVFAQVRAPDMVGWAALGFMLDHSLAQQLRAISGTEVSFVTHQGDGAGKYTVSTRDGSDPLASGSDAENFLTLSAPLMAQDGSIDLVLQRSLHDALEQFHAMRFALLMIAAAALLGAFVMALFMGRGAVRPLSALVSAARGIQQGEYQQHLDVGNGEEFRRLADTFMAMQEGIRAREQRIVQQATHDTLTGLPNREGLRERLQVVLAEGGVLSLALIDIYRFRDLNASVGHQRGDLLLQELALRLRQMAGPGQLVARVGADQFMLALPIRDEDMRRQLESLAAELRQGMAVEQVTLSVILRGGLSQWRGSAVALDDLLRQAEVALVEAKEHESVAVIYQASHDTEHQRRIMLVAELREAILKDGLTLAYQPLVQTTNRAVVGLEALLRWTHPTLGPISPAEFVPLAERASTVSELSRWVLSAAISQMGRWQSQGIDIEVAVNLSPSDLLDPGLPERLFGLLREHGVPASRLMLEVTESAIMREPENAVRVMHQLRAAGVRFAIDDFGTGHSSLAQLHALPVDELKIDRAFIMDLAQSSSNLAIVRATTEMAHQLGLRVVAEGVETPEVWTVLLRLGCDLAQGYYISRPMEAQKVPEWVRAQRVEVAEAMDSASHSGAVTTLRPRGA